MIGMNNIKQRRLTELTLDSHPGLYVGQCAPFYFCPRSVMLYLIHKRNPELAYKGGQEPIVHLEADLRDAVAWAKPTAGGGPSRCPTRARTTSKTGPTWRSWARSTGMRCQQRSGRP
jgi:hypothetical protein